MGARKTFTTVARPQRTAWRPPPLSSPHHQHQHHRSPTSRRPEVSRPRRQDAETSETAPRRSAFTWRLTPEQANELDELVLRMRRELGLGRLDRAEVLLALVQAAGANRAVYADVLKRLETS